MLASVVPLLVTPVSGYLLDQGAPAHQLYLPIFVSHCALRLISLPLIGSLDLGMGKSLWIKRHSEMQRKLIDSDWFCLTVPRTFNPSLRIQEEVKLCWKTTSDFAEKEKSAKISVHICDTWSTMGSGGNLPVHLSYWGGNIKTKSWHLSVFRHYDRYISIFAIFVFFLIRN